MHRFDFELPLEMFDVCHHCHTVAQNIPDKDKIHPSPKTTQTSYQPPTHWLKTPPNKDKIHPSHKTTQTPYQPSTQWLKTPPDKDKIHPSPKTTQTPYQPPTQWLKTIDLGYKKKCRKIFHP